VDTTARIKYLLQGYIAGTLSREEKASLLHFFEDDSNANTWEGMITELMNKDDVADAGVNEAALNQLIADVLKAGKEKEQKVIPMNRRKPWWLYAAAALLLIFGSLYLYNGRKPVALPLANIPSKATDIKPGGNHAVLTLANGKTILLDSAAIGRIGAEGAAQIVKSKEGALAYQSPGKDSPDDALNILETPAGGQYQLTLADGTRVWLNALSSLKFPAGFTAGTRSVELTGEAYFEVAKDASRPFVVHVNGAAVRVYGTHFNIMAYHNEQALETTLLEGSVSFANGDKQVMLKPGQQSRLTQDADVKLIDDVDLDQVVAWKNGWQSFNNANIQTILRQIERWYSIKAEYKGAVTKRRFTGDIPRSATLSEVLKLFKVNHINCELDAENKKIILMPQN